MLALASRLAGQFRGCTRGHVVKCRDNAAVACWTDRVTDRCRVRCIGLERIDPPPASLAHRTAERTLHIRRPRIMVPPFAPERHGLRVQQIVGDQHTPLAQRCDGHQQFAFMSGTVTSIMQMEICLGVQHPVKNGDYRRSRTFIGNVLQKAGAQNLVSDNHITAIVARKITPVATDPKQSGQFVHHTKGLQEFHAVWCPGLDASRFDTPWYAKTHMEILQIFQHSWQYCLFFRHLLKMFPSLPDSFSGIPWQQIALSPITKPGAQSRY